MAVGAVFDARGRVLIARRPLHAHQGGLWEFPGGKVLPGESVRQALRRELDEEVGIDLQHARPLIRIPHSYPDRRVLLDVWRSDGFTGGAWGREGQPVMWAAPDELQAADFPAANRPIINAVRLPDRYAVTDEPREGPASFLARLERVLDDGVTLVQLRAKTLAEAAFLSLAEAAVGLCRARGARLLLNAPPEWLGRVDADGVHLTSARLLACSDRPLGAGRWVAASCHSYSELVHAQRIGADFVVVGPVLATTSHPGAPLLGWEGLRRLTEEAIVPVFALGGVGPPDLPTAWTHGAQGIAAISALWRR